MFVVFKKEKADICIICQANTDITRLSKHQDVLHPGLGLSICQPGALHSPILDSVTSQALSLPLASLLIESHRPDGACCGATSSNHPTSSASSPSVLLRTLGFVSSKSSFSHPPSILLILSSVFAGSTLRVLSIFRTTLMSQSVGGVITIARSKARAKGGRFVQIGQSVSAVVKVWQAYVGA